MPDEVVTQFEIDAPAPVPERFPMGLEEYTVTVGLDPLLEAALAVWVPKQDRLQSEWDAILAAYRVLPITS